MSNRLFQGVIHQMKDTVDRNIGVIDENFVIVVPTRALLSEIANNIIVDGHYCFPIDNEFETVFSDEDKNLYDVFLYLRVKPEDAHTRISVSDKNKKFENLCIEEISQWQDKEISELRDICFAAHKEFIVLIYGRYWFFYIIDYTNLNGGINDE